MLIIYFNWSSITFPSGYVVFKESFANSTIREDYEETSLTISNLKHCGVKQFMSRDYFFRYAVFLHKN